MAVSTILSFIPRKYVEVVIGRGWSSREVSDMLKAYYEENYDNLF